MKRLSKILATLLFTSFVGSAMASSAHYGAPQKSLTNGVKSGFTQYVTIVNHTGLTFNAYAMFYNSGTPSYMQLGPQGTGQDLITYTINNPPDFEVCYQIKDLYNNVIPGGSGCLQSGEVDVNYSSLTKKTVASVVH